MLSKEERLQIIESQEKTVAYSRYGLELNVLREMARSAPNKETADALNKQIADLDAEIAILAKAREEVEKEAD